ncbi:precorrin-6A synthase (deacetylating) [Acidocella aminolytica]|uniref:Precorrin-6A synthase [deacetylating] n=1 Tax=Acidocella aminolytica 101 = DSM 11237 TaxID=1120923 RepID=A0A0D6PEN6_9PROT|nr:precorrin-6A synthase (deacetylating) [Acidocella aminolytica]GAN79663.1 precorrin 6A synthase [Acidocella aminolytica 101 = DSM 11237]GBQ41308.1 precorrin-2 methylase [Acidocella aminolytica 101 = DSM 11237]SHF05197.1 precorrin-6A synthase (deacetylating) [Acidocella aminolytica 101 = DSM 11237]
MTARLCLIGIGTGNPEHLTLEAVKAMRAADVILIPRKGADKADLAALRQSICADVLGDDTARLVAFDLPVRDAANLDYRAGVEAWHDAIAACWKQVLDSTLPQGGEAALLVWGDPSLYDSTLRIAARLGLKVRVVPGITSIQALTAAHGMVLNEIGAPFLVTTGRRLREGGWPQGVETLVVMLDGGCAFQTLAPKGVEIWWGAYLGMAAQIILSGTLAEAGPEIIQARKAARAVHGWIMDIYILRWTGAV